MSQHVCSCQQLNHHPARGRLSFHTAGAEAPRVGSDQAHRLEMCTLSCTAHQEGPERCLVSAGANAERFPAPSRAPAYSLSFMLAFMNVSDGCPCPVWMLAMSELSPGPIIKHCSWLGQPLPFFGSVPWGRRSQSRNPAWAGKLTWVFLETGSEFPAVSVCFLGIASGVSKHVPAGHGWSLRFLHP